MDGLEDFEGVVGREGVGDDVVECLVVGQVRWEVVVVRGGS